LVFGWINTRVRFESNLAEVVRGALLENGGVNNVRDIAKYIGEGHFSSLVNVV
jgi:hypothetical protein